MEDLSEGHGLKLLLLILALSTIIDGLDASIVNVALPTISSDMHVSVGDTSWITFVYLVPIASLLLPLSKLARNGLTKRIFLLGVVLFTVSSVVCGISSIFFELVLFRLIQGIGAALMTASVPAIIVRFVPSDKKGVGMGILAVASGIAIVLGPSVGGFITSLLSWHWIFFVNVPFGVFTVLLAMKIIPKDEGYSRDLNPDLQNCMFTILSLGCAMMFIQNLVGSELGLTAECALCVLAVVFMALVIRRVHAHPETALVSSKLLARRDFQLLSVAFTMTCMVIMGVQYVLPYNLNIAGGFSESESGMLISIASIFAILLSVPVGRWCDKRGCKVPSVLAGVGRLVFCLVFMIASPKDDLHLLVLGLVIMGCSMAFAGTGLATAMIHHSDIDNQGDATTFLLEINYVAASIGVAVFAMIFQAALGESSAGNVTAAMIDRCFDDTMLLGCALSAVAIFCAYVVKNIVPKKS